MIAAIGYDRSLLQQQGDLPNFTDGATREQKKNISDAVEL
jgi:hypothetical protein